jgi:hypothetical protein
MKENGSDLEKEIEGIYTPLSVAKEEIWHRWNDEALRKKVEYFLGGDIPEPFKKEPRAVLFRQVMTPDFECERFLDLSMEINLNPLGWEYLEDKFSTRNHDKVGLCKMAFFGGKNKKGENLINYKKIINLTESDNEKFNKIKTLQGENFVDFHHRIFLQYGLKLEFFDASEWFKKNGNSAEKYYKQFMTFFIRNGILFENFVTDESERKFAENIVYPAINEVEKIFKIKPLIVPLAPINEASDNYWWCYADSIKNKVKII